ncbi:MAG: hypothetical protein M1836_005596 [Candelina mexicana]|nr:MAG: hypothetical protein M1836_005596 [Candelina mexicana]
MYSIYLAAALLSVTVSGQGEIYPRQSAVATDPAQFSSAANQLISLYLPPSVGVPIAVALQSAASAAGVTGDINSIVNSALIATSAPSFLTAVPTEYKTNIAALQGAISSLRGAASAGTITGAARVITSTNSAGSAVVTTVPGAANATGGAAAAVITTTNSAGSTFTTTSMRANGLGAAGNGTSGGNATVITTNGTTITSTNGASPFVAVVTTTDSVGSVRTETQTSGPSTTSGQSSASSTAAAAPASTTKAAAYYGKSIPTAAAAGVLGFVGLLAAL